jgi:hypothetical protein
MIENSEIDEFIDNLDLVDHHVHSTLVTELSRGEFESFLTESTEPIPAWMTQFDSQIGFAVRAYCAPILGLPRHADADEYWRVRSLLTPAEATRLMLTTSKVSTSLVDTGVIAGEASNPTLFDLPDFARHSGQSIHEIVRLETVLEGLVAEGVIADTFEDMLDESLKVAARTAVGFKSIIAYRYGFDFDPAEPSSDDIRSAAATWLASIGSDPIRVTDPVLLRMLLWKGVRTGLPVQLHAGMETLT